MSEPDIEVLLQAAIESVGAERLKSELATLATESDQCTTLTLVCNSGVHKIPSKYLRGEVYSISHGNFDASTATVLTEELINILSDLAKVLRSNTWKQVYLLPTGHPIISINAKAIVYRLLRINTVDICYLNGEYMEVELNHRDIALSLE